MPPHLSHHLPILRTRNLAPCFAFQPLQHSPAQLGVSWCRGESYFPADNMCACRCSSSQHALHPAVRSQACVSCPVFLLLCVDHSVGGPGVGAERRLRNFGPLGELPQGLTSSNDERSGGDGRWGLRSFPLLCLSSFLFWCFVPICLVVLLHVHCSIFFLWVSSFLSLFFKLKKLFFLYKYSSTFVYNTFELLLTPLYSCFTIFFITSLLLLLVLLLGFLY